jgi:hypothetical protein
MANDKDFKVGDVTTSKGTKFTVTDVNPERQQVSWAIEKTPEFDTTFKKFVELKNFIKKLSETLPDDPKIKEIAQETIKQFNAFRYYLRTTHPEQYKKFKNLAEIKIKNHLTKKIKEISATGTGASFTPGSGAQTATPFAFNSNKNAKGTKKPYFYKLGYKLAPHQPMDESGPGASLGKGPSAGSTGVKNNYYTKLGFKLVDKKKLNRQAKGIEVKQLWKENNESNDYINSLNIESPELKKFIESRISGFDKIENKIKELHPLLQNAKQKTMDTYKQKPNFAIIYGTDLAIDYLDDIIKMFKN